MKRRNFLTMLSAMVSFIGFKPIIPIVNADESSVEGSDILWGTFGKNGKEPLRWVKIMDCETDYLQAILRTQSHVYLNGPLLKSIQNILKFRGAAVPPLNYDCVPDKRK